MPEAPIKEHRNAFCRKGEVRPPRQRQMSTPTGYAFIPQKLFEAEFG
jgi:hypothetical protein